MQLKSLQQGRGLAAMAVVAFHLSLLLQEPRYLGKAILLDFTHRGNLGVDFFFVLSGFIIVFAHQGDIDHPRQVADYLMKRLIRLFPVYWLYTAIFCTLVGLGFGSAAIFPETSGNWISTIFLIRLDSFELPITPAWTLIHEAAFYLVFATLIFNRKLGVLVMVAWIIAGGIVFQYPNEGFRSPLTTYFSPLNFNFIIGMAAFYLWKTSRYQALKIAFPAGLALLVITYVIESNWLPYEYVQIAYAVSFGLLIAGAAAWEADGFPASRFRLLSLIGDASYTIYLTHLAFLGLIAKFLTKVSGLVPINSYVFYFVAFVAAVFSGCILYLFVERPLLKACRKYLLGDKPAPSLATKVVSPNSPCAR
ncbi:peptidoglycan/LPS O-acetylase OafA/YrhL [Phyllobacterium myrsinacearum]|jgi:exopolysaccharide production protein ExoZ|uniref:Acyltransferase 3 domain-containing protein n=2 Tax=Phyllobacterium myrsinacearum TaxID=28101 RepID=A0A2S9JGS2_9HYPH|nr:hypothetical protein C5750_14835 [Phyllobacterium myrsinacearum]PWV83763.1 peptidoglycan/LPS O-acetylase OafA/YrhL [Phyllobacterium myrsinacearum]RZV04714.1 peptidoglycan/LPS O-acetylase OafA/YrhL [Phyllobacterium myrsinacearum]